MHSARRFDRPVRSEVLRSQTTQFVRIRRRGSTNEFCTLWQYAVSIIDEMASFAAIRVGLIKTQDLQQKTEFSVE